MRLFLAVLAVAALAMPADASHCTDPGTSETELSSCMEGVDVRCFYVDIDTCPQCGVSIWIYEESNGMPGLQRGDEIENNTCHGLVQADTIIF